MLLFIIFIIYESWNGSAANALSLSLLTVSLCLSLTSSLFFQGEPINMLPTWHWITKACCWLRSENQPCAALLCRCLCQFLSDICVLTCAPFWRTHLDKTPKARRHCTQWSKGKAIIAILPEGGCFSFKLFFSLFPFSFALCTNNTAAQIDMFLFFPPAMTSRSYCLYCSPLTGRCRSVVEFFSKICRLYLLPSVCGFSCVQSHCCWWFDGHCVFAVI